MAFPLLAAAGVMAGGTILQFMAQSEAANEKKRAAEAESESRRAMARELLLRARMNERVIQEEGEVFKARQISAGARANTDPSGGTMALIRDTAAKVHMTILNNRRESAYQAAQLRSGAADIEAGIGPMMRASRLSQVGTLLSGAGSIMSLHDPNPKSKTSNWKPMPSEGSSVDFGGISGTVGPSGGFGSIGGGYA